MPSPPVDCPPRSPACIEHTPSFGNFPGEHGQVRYGEGVLIGYRWYEARQLPVQFPFGHGLSYTRSTIGTPRTATPRSTPRQAANSSVVPLTNTGQRRGAEVVQLYVGAVAAHGRASAEGAEGVPEGVARPRRDKHGHADTRLPIVRVLGSGRHLQG